MTVFNISDKSISKKILLQVILKPGVKEPIKNSRKRPRSWTPTSPSYSPTQHPHPLESISLARKLAFAKRTSDLTFLRLTTQVFGNLCLWLFLGRCHY